MPLPKSYEATISLIKLAEEYVFESLKKDLPNHIYFHNSEHTDQVYKAAKKLAKAAGLNQEDKEILLLASLFHGTGYTENNKNYWDKSVVNASRFLEENDAPEELIKKVTGLILLLGKNIQPKNELDKLFLDACNSYLGSKKFIKRIRRLQKEKEEQNGEKTTALNWQKEQLKKLHNHFFCTHFGEELFGKRKLKNIEKLKGAHKNSLKIKAEREKRTSVSANSGARTLFKTALRNHIDLTSIADQKANMMLSINALIITIGLPAFATYLSGTSYLIIPAIIFLLTSVITMIIATLSTRPVRTNGETDMSKLLSGKTNLFFFGNFYKISRDDYEKGIKTIVADREYLDTSFINDLYYLGIALGDKFRLLRICYNVFVIGVSLSLLAFIITYLIS
jgi:HD superfamily phosphodiesterase